MGQGELCLLLSVQWWGLWGGTDGQRPVWYQVGMEPAPGETPVQSQPSLGIAAGALGWPGLAYWSLALTLVLGALIITILLPRWGHSPEKPQVTPRTDGHGTTGSSNAALADVLHVLDAVMEKMGRRLQCRERRRSAQC